MIPTIRDVQTQLGPNDRILVVADNCTDDTAAIVQAAGVEVTVRADPAPRQRLCAGVRCAAPGSQPSSAPSSVPGFRLRACGRHGDAPQASLPGRAETA